MQTEYLQQKHTCKYLFSFHITIKLYSFYVGLFTYNQNRLMKITGVVKELILICQN